MTDEVTVQRYGRAAALLEFTSRPWAVMPSALAAIGETLRHSHSGDVIREAAPVSRGRRQTAGAVAVIPLRGVITPRPSFMSMLFGFGGGGLEGFRDDFRQAVDDDDVASILIDVDSPGGLADQVPETAAEILGSRGSKPIVAIANTTAASAAYFLASQADEMVVTPSGMVGSIGVYMVHTDWSAANEQEGLKVSYVFAGKYKTERNEDEPLSDEARSHMQDLVDEPYDLFVAAVAAGRGVSEDTVRSGYGEGRVLPAGMALAEGMVDSIETFDQVVSRLVRGDAPSTTGASAAVLEAERIVRAAGRQSAAAPTSPGVTAPVDTPPVRREDPRSALPDWLTVPNPPAPLQVEEA